MTDKTEFPNEFKKLLDINRIKKSTKDLDKLKVTLKKDKLKGVGLYATKPIKEGELIAYYKLKTFSFKKYESPTDMVYSFEVYTKKGKESKRLIADICLESIPKPKKNIPYWAMFVNEPYNVSDANAEIDKNLKDNYKHHKRIKKDMYIVYKLIATKDIKPNEEITMYYGAEYHRDYDINIDESF